MIQVRTFSVANDGKSNLNWLINKRNLLVYISAGSGTTLASGTTWSRGLCNVLQAHSISKSPLCLFLFWLHSEGVSYWYQNSCSVVKPHFLTSSNSVYMWTLFFLKSLVKCLHVSLALSELDAHHWPLLLGQRCVKWFPGVGGTIALILIRLSRREWVVSQRKSKILKGSKCPL